MIAAKTLLEYLTHPTMALPHPRSAEAAAQEILRIMAQPEHGGGATYSLYFGDQPGEPFFAAALDNRLTQRLPDRTDLFDAVTSFLQLHRDLLLHPRCSVGIWMGVNPDGARMLFLDVTVLVYNESAARAFGARGNQIAIFDLKRKVEIDTGGTGLPVPGTPPPAERLRQLQAEDLVEIAEGADHGNANRG